MSTTTTPGSWTELYTDLLNRMREQTGVTATTVLAKRYINLANQLMYVGTSEKLPWAKRRAFITTHPSYTTGTVSVTVGSATVTGTDTLWTTTNSYGQANARAGGKIVIEGDGDTTYLVTAVGGAGTMTISPAWVGATDTSATYTYFEDEYALATSFARPYDFTSFDDAQEITLIGDQEFRRHYPRNRHPADHAHHATLIDLPFDGNTTPVRKVRFAPPPSGAKVVPYTYITKHVVVSAAGTEQESFTADTDEPIMPLRYRHALVLRAMVEWYRDRKDDTRSQQCLAEYQALMRTIVDDQEAGQQRMSMRPNTAPYARARRPYRGRGGRRRYDTNDAFDRLQD